jgi:hypothetical protein
MTTSTAVPIRLTADEVRLLRNALATYIADFGHDEAEIQDAARELLARLSTATGGRADHLGS